MRSSVLPLDARQEKLDAWDVARGSDVMLQCPLCRGAVQDLECTQCCFRMETRHGIVHSLPPERVEHYARFVSEYERIRAAEGRGSDGDAYYLALPYADLTGRNSHQWAIRATSFNFLIRRLLPEGTGGTILDLGAGNCWMSFHLARLGYMPVAVDLLTNDSDGLGAAGHFERYLESPIPRFRAEASRLPFADAQFDVILFNASFHYAENYEATLGEALRCLKAGGRVILSDTPWYSKEESGNRMIAERRAQFQSRFGTSSDAIPSLEFLTNARLQDLERRLSIRWTVHRPWYGWRWAMRPWIARLKGDREPSRFRMYVARKHVASR